MKKIIISIFVIAVILGISYFYLVNKKEAIAPVVVPPVVTNTKSTVVTDTKPAELCFAKFGAPDVNGSYDRDTLRLIVNGEKVTGELNLLPAESDSKTGEIKGTVGPINTTTMTRTADLEWFTFAGGTNTEKVKIIFGAGSASVKQGTSTLDLPELPCLNLIERTNVENYLSDNISELSPIKAVLGGTWYVVYATVDLEKNTGVVAYEDGHLSEKKNFSYTTNAKGEVVSLTIK